MTEQTDARMIIGKWLNEQPNREVDRVALAELCAEVDALRKELEQVKMHNVMLLDSISGTRDEILHATGPIEINDILDIYDYGFPDITSEQIEAYRAEIIAQSADTIRMDWLVSHVVEVRNRLAYGSEHMFTSQITDHDEEEVIFSTNLREQIDAAIRNNKE